MRLRSVAAIAAAALSVAATVRADEPSPPVPWLQHDLRFDLGFAWDSAVSGQGPIANALFAGTSLEPSVDLVAAGATVERHGLRARLLLGAGAAVDRLHAPSTSAWRHLLEGSLGYTLPVGRGLTVEAGVFPAHIGFESFYTRDNWNATHGWISLESPFFHAAVRARYPLTDELQLMVLWLNGWNPVDVEGAWRSLGAQLAFTHGPASASLNLYVGPVVDARGAPGGGGERYFGDLVGQVEARAGLRFAASFDAGLDTRSDGRLDSWYALAVWARLELTRWLALSIRSDLFDDRQGGAITGRTQILAEATLTEEVSLGPLVIRLDARVDRADAPTPALDGKLDRELLVLAVSGRL